MITKRNAHRFKLSFGESRGLHDYVTSAIILGQIFVRHACILATELAPAVPDPSLILTRYFTYIAPLLFRPGAV